MPRLERRIRGEDLRALACDKCCPMPFGCKRDSWGRRADGTEPTGRAIALKGASIFRVEGDKVVSDQCYFDRAALAEQLQPKASQ
jgi:predicted ester cyclase